MKTPVGAYSATPHKTIEDLVALAAGRATSGEHPGGIIQDIVDGYGLGWQSANHRLIEQTATTAAGKAITEINQDIARAKVLRRELAMLRSAQPHLSGIPARHNLTRITEREDELNTLAFIIDHADSVGVEEVVRCNALAAMEGL